MKGRKKNNSILPRPTLALFSHHRIQSVSTNMRSTKRSVQYKENITLDLKAVKAPVGQKSKKKTGISQCCCSHEVILH